MQELVENLRAALGERIEQLDWMTRGDEEGGAREARDVHAEDRLSGQVAGLFGARGPARTIPSATPTARPCATGITSVARLGKPVDRDEWGMTPQTINAYYNPRQQRDRVPGGDPAAAVLRSRMPTRR